MLITRHGKPAALVIGVEGHDIEDVLLRQDLAFWKLVEERRRPVDRASGRRAQVTRSPGVHKEARPGS